MIRHAPSHAPIVSASLHEAGIVAVALSYLSLPYISNTYIAWLLNQDGEYFLVVQWERNEDFHQKVIPLNYLNLSVEQLVVVQGWLS